MRVGFGYDIHPLKAGRQLVLGGVVIPFEKGLDGHSDADVLCHAVSDAVLGAAALGDIGEHFPNTDPTFRNVSSLDLLKKVGEMAAERGCSIVNIDTVVVAEAPRLLPFREEMRGNVAQALGIDPSRVSVKATTHEGFGEVGRGEAIAAYAVAGLDEGP